MTATIVVAEDNDEFRRLISNELAAVGYRVIDVPDGKGALSIIKREPVDLLITDILMPAMDGIELLGKVREVCPDLPAIVMTSSRAPEDVINALKLHACDLLPKPFEIGDLPAAVRNALKQTHACEIDVISAKPDWVELTVPCDLDAIGPLTKFMTELEADLPPKIRENIGSAFREMLTNAIEHGGKLDPTKRVDVKCVRLKRVILYSIKDPGEGFNLEKLKHAAVSNPEAQPLRHMDVRQEMGMRPGGYGILLASEVIDELVYNEKHNELIFVKYLEGNN